MPTFLLPCQTIGWLREAILLFKFNFNFNFILSFIFKLSHPSKSSSPEGTKGDIFFFAHASTANLSSKMAAQAAGWRQFFT